MSGFLHNNFVPNLASLVGAGHGQIYVFLKGVQHTTVQSMAGCGATVWLEFWGSQEHQGVEQGAGALRGHLLTDANDLDMAGG